MSELLWIAVPGGRVVGGKAVLRALVVPRLDGAPSKRLTDHGMQHWPETLAAAALNVAVRGNVGDDETPVGAARRDLVRPGAWGEFFGAATAVRQWSVQRSFETFHVDETSQHAGRIEEIYRTSAQALSPLGPPSRAEAQPAGDGWGSWDGPPPSNGSSSGGPEWVEPDFHGIVARLREHPCVLGALGLIVELSIAADELSQTSDGTTKQVIVRCVPAPGAPPDLPTMASAWTTYAFDGDRFLAAPSDSLIAAGMVDLTGVGAPGTVSAAGWNVVAFDVDGAVDGLRHAGRSEAQGADVALQGGWRWCKLCQGLAHSALGNGVCPTGAGHDFSESGNYSVALGAVAPGAQGGWRWCKLCQGLAHSALGNGVCPTGAGHDFSESGNYSVALGEVAPGAQGGWRWCKLCQGLAHSALGNGVCPTGAGHDFSESGNYSVALGAVAPGAGRAVPPALRSAGLALVRNARRRDFATRLEAAARNAERVSMHEAVLSADDLVLGYRIDIRQDRGEWRSLMRRQAAYRVGAIVFGPDDGEEEGHVKPHAAIREAPGAPLRADELVTRWNGWSLAVGRPTFDDFPDRSRPRRLRARPYDFEWAFAVPDGSLPELRFGRDYQIRARVADVAGGGLRLGDAHPEDYATAEVRYARYEPIAPPELSRAPAGAGAGATVDRLVIRSDPGVDADADADTRELVPPPTTFMLAEQHGVLDGADDRTWELAQRAMALPAQLPAPSGEDPGGPERLADPAARGVRLELLSTVGPATGQRTARATWGGAWPDLQRLRLVLRDVDQPHAAPISLEAVGDELVVRLAAAQRATIAVSSVLRDGYLPQFALRDWLVENASGRRAEASAENAADGDPMLTPPRMVELVHAVRRPLTDPCGDLIITRREGETTAEIGPDISVDRPSTGEVEIEASWDEPSDGAGPPAHVETHVGSITVKGDDEPWPGLVQEFGDTRHRMVTYRLRAVSRFGEFFEEEDPDTVRVVTSLDPISVPCSARPSAPTVLSMLPAFEWELHSAPGLIERVRRGNRVRVELAGPWFETGLDERLAVVVWKERDAPPKLWPSLTQVGRDPIWDTPSPDRGLTADAFGAMAGEPRELVLPDTGETVIAVPHEVWFHDGRRYADISLANLPMRSYCPLVQLAVARYQPDSLTGLELSPVVKSDTVALLPDRKLTVQREMVLLEPGDTVPLRDTPVYITLSGLGPSGPVPNRVDVVVEQCAPGIDAGRVDLVALEAETEGTPAWSRVDGPRVSGALGERLTVWVPPQDGTALRVRVREVEQIGPDAGSPSSVGTSVELTERTVFTDTVPLPPYEMQVEQLD